jgi:hypothetical protein
VSKAWLSRIIAFCLGQVHVHVEIEVSNLSGTTFTYGMSASRGGWYRIKDRMRLRDEWDFLEFWMTESQREQLMYWLYSHDDCPYDYLAAIGLILPITGSEGAMNCTEFVCRALQFMNKGAFSYLPRNPSPTRLFRILEHHYAGQIGR